MNKYYYTLLLFFWSTIFSLAQTNRCQNIVETSGENWVCAEEFEDGYRVLSTSEDGQYIEHVLDFNGNFKYSQTTGQIQETFEFKDGAILTKSIDNVVVDSIYFPSLSNIATGVVAKTTTGWVLVYIDDSPQANTVKLVRFNENTQTTSEVNGLSFNSRDQQLSAIYALPNNEILLAIEKDPFNRLSTTTIFVKIDGSNNLVSNFDFSIFGGYGRISPSPCNSNEVIVSTYNEFVVPRGGRTNLSHKGVYNILDTTLIPKILTINRNSFTASNFVIHSFPIRTIQSYQSNGDYFKFSNQSSYLRNSSSTPLRETHGLEIFLEKYDKDDNLLWKEDFLIIRGAPEPVTDTVLLGEPQFFFDLPNNEFIAFGPAHGGNKLFTFKSNCELEPPPNHNDNYICGAINIFVEGTQLTIQGQTGVAYQRMELINITDGKYEPSVLCSGNCGASQTVDVAEGKYLIKVFNEDWTIACNMDYNTPIIISNSDNGDNGGENTVGKTNCDSLIFTGENRQITIEGLTATYNKVEIIGRNTDWQVITICDGNCEDTQVIPDLMTGEYTVKINQSGNDGSYCYKEEKVNVSEDDGSNSDGSANCDNLSFTEVNGQILVGGLTASYDKIEIIGQNTNWQIVTICDGDCSDTQNIPDLANGEYAVKVNQGGNDGTYCYREEKVVVTNSSFNRNSKIDYSNELVLYPNPVRDRINLKFHRLAEKEGAIHIYNAFGQMIRSFPKTQFTNDGLSIDLNGYENGMYLLTIKMDKLPLMTKRFIVEHLK